jgi:hypothetical protein
MGEREAAAGAQPGSRGAAPERDLASRQDLLTGRTFEQIVPGVPTCRYGRSLEAVPDEIESRGESKSAVSRRFVRHGPKMLAERLTRRLDVVQLAALLIEGIHFEEGRS